MSRLTRIRILFVLKINHFEFLSASLETQKKMGKERVSKEPWRKPCSESRKRIFSILSFTISLYFTTTNLTGTYLDHKMSVNVYNDIFRFSKSLVTLLRKNNKLVYKSMTSLRSCFSSESEDVIRAISWVIDIPLQSKMEAVVIRAKGKEYRYLK